MRGQDWRGRVNAIFAASGSPISSGGGRNVERPRVPIGQLHVLARLRDAVVCEWPDGLQRRGLAARDNRTTAIPPPSHRMFQPTEEEAAGRDLPLGRNSHTRCSLAPCRTLSTGHSAGCSRPPTGTMLAIGALTTKAHDVADSDLDTYTLLGAGITNILSLDASPFCRSSTLNLSCSFLSHHLLLILPSVVYKKVDRQRQKLVL